MRRSERASLFAFLAAATTLSTLSLAEGCSAQKDQGTPGTLEPGKDGSVKVDESGTPIDDDTGVDDGGGFNAPDVKAIETTPGCSGVDPDCDKDGYPQSQDCNDKDGTINPEAYDFEGDGVDNDCDGTVDNPVTTCVAPLGSTNPMDFGRAADLCAQRAKTKGGVVFDPLVKAEWGSVKGGFGTSSTKMDQVKIVNAFGENKPRLGDTLFGLQSGPWGAKDPRKSKAYDLFPVQNACTAIPLTGKDCESLSNGTSPIPGFGTASVQDWAEVRLFIQVPSNANAMLFDFSFFSTEFNEFWNSPFNDAFFVLVTSKGIKGANVAKDAKGLALTVNSGFFQLCPKPPGPPGLSKAEALSKAPCVGSDGDAAAKVFGTLKGTNFDGAGAGSTDGTVPGGGGDAGTGKYVYGGGSGWLTTKFAVEPSEKIVVRFIVHDTSDGILDSAAIVDNIRWDKAPPKVPTGEVERPPK